MPTDAGRTLKLRYIMQIKTRPPTFFVYANDKNLIDDNFERFFRNSIAEEFGFEGVPIRLLLRDNKMQYARKNGAYLNPNTRAVLDRIKMYK
jgi:predicted GTPase